MRCGLIVGLLLPWSAAFAANDDNVTTKPAVRPALEVLDVDLGEKVWGLNLLKVRVRNTTQRGRTFSVHIGSGKRRLDPSRGFGMGDVYTLKAGTEGRFEVWYWIAPGHGTVDAVVTFRSLDGPEDPRVWKAPAFWTRTYPITFTAPNKRCGNLNIAEKIPDYRQYYKGVKHLQPFEAFKTRSFVFYCSPGTPAHKDIRKIMAQREAGFRKVCDFVGIAPARTIMFFFYPDRLTKKMCTLHTGDGMASGNTIAEVYNDRVKLDPYHEATHVLMRQVGDPPAILNEGFACYMSERLGAPALKYLGGGDKSLYGRVRHLRSQRQWIPLSELLTYAEIGSHKSRSTVSYPEAGAFVKFLITTYGKEKFLKAYAALRNARSDDQIKPAGEANRRKLEAIYGLPLKALETKWLTTIDVEGPGS